MNTIINPKEIEKKSFETITEKLAGRQLDPQNANIIKRVIHTTADFDYLDNLTFSADAAKKARKILKNGANIVTYTQMAKAGINKKAASQLGCNLYCFIDSAEVAAIAQTNETTRSHAAVDRASEIVKKPIIFVVGNAPTALIRLYELITEHAYNPDFIIAVPVGFVNVVESKELIMKLDTPHIVAKGQKGGSNVAAAICNALLYDII